MDRKDIISEWYRELGSIGKKERWAKIPKEDRVKHAEMMAKARWAKKKLSTPPDSDILDSKV